MGGWGVWVGWSACVYPFSQSIMDSRCSPGFVQEDAGFKGENESDAGVIYKVCLVGQ